MKEDSFRTGVPPAFTNSHYQAFQKKDVNGIPDCQLADMRASLNFHVQDQQISTDKDYQGKQLFPQLLIIAQLGIFCLATPPGKLPVC